MGDRWFRSLATMAVVVAAATFTLGLNGASSRAEAATVEEPALGSTRSNPLPSPQALYVRGTHGYDVAVLAVPISGSGAPAVAIEAVDQTGRVSYSAPGSLSDEGIRADFGKLGRVDLRWVPSGRVAKVHVKCRTYQYDRFVEEGSYVGTLRFGGPDSFTKATATRISGQTGWFWLRGCEFRTGEAMPGPGEILEAERRKSREPRESHRSLDVVQNHRGERVSFRAVDAEQRGRIAIYREAYATGGPHTIDFDPSFKTASIQPPPPFDGSGEFERRDHARGSWSGSLSVDFPDLHDVPLAGDDFEAIFHSGSREAESLRPLPLPAWPSTKPWPTASARSSAPGPS